ncbi:GlxA family transcriptional regulator [Flaviflagellibacter deserti]|uniref:GlxA family transcriptional regulator n=1 Tax=Flaviflagellibacter deserti TaxID=2267266 RepID=A0ABV9YZA3_9HYPH
MRSVAIVVFPGVQALDVAGPVDVFAEANGFLPKGDGYAVTLVGTEAGPFRASNGMQFVADITLDQTAERYDYVFVAGGPLLPVQPANSLLSRWLVVMARRADAIGSICTGAFALGHAGLLNGKRVTTHWQNAPVLAEQFPDASVEYDRIFLRDGTLVTSAGVTAGIDLALALVAEDHGSNIALLVAKRLVVVAQRQGGQSQFSPYLNAAEPGSPIAKVQAHVMANISESFTVERLASVAGMSERNFARQFAQAAKMTPHEFVEGARIDAARNLLEGTDKPLKTIAFDCGFGSPDRMRLVFLKRMGLTPAQYRASFHADETPFPGA